jgi:hypothetical protein
MSANGGIARSPPGMLFHHLEQRLFSAARGMDALATDRGRASVNRRRVTKPQLQS